MVDKNYIEPISEADSRRYAEKLTVFGHRLPDPYYAVKKEEWKRDLADLPSVTFPDLYVYCVHKKGVYTNEEVRAFRSLEAHNYFTSGFVQEIQTKKFEISTPEKKSAEVVFMKTGVLPSQRVGQKAKPYAVWCLCHSSGEIISAHCTCMAGLDETCSHVLAVLFKAQFAVLLGLNRKSATSTACQWNMQFRKSVTAAKVKDIQLAPKKRKQAHDGALLDVHTKKQIDEEAMKFGKENNCAFMLCVDEPHERQAKGQIPYTLMKICDISRLSQPGKVSASYCEVFVNKLPQMFMQQELNELERRTRSQSKCKLWFDHRQGRVTASTFGEVLACRESGRDGSGLATRICERAHFTGGKMPEAMRWGKDNEEQATKYVIEHLGKEHDNLEYHHVGLLVKKDVPYLGASPDGVITCTCPSCPTKRLLEVKCPFSIRNRAPTLAQYLTKDEHLDQRHHYYAQVQGQLALAGVRECVFAVYTLKGLHLCSVFLDEPYVKKMMSELHAFFVGAVLPLLLTK